MAKTEAKSRYAALDIEVYRNYFLAVFVTEKGVKHEYEILNDTVTKGNLETIKGTVKNQTLITFNGNNYDLPILFGAMQGFKNAELKRMSDTIIVEDVPSWKLSEHFPKLRTRRCDHIDLIGVTPLQASLKTYMCRIHSKRLQDLPIHPDSDITEEQAAELLKYCHNDVRGTWEVFKEMQNDLLLRVNMGAEYGLDFRSKSGPQIAEAVIRQRMEDNGHAVEKRTEKVSPFKYNVPDFIQFATPELQALLETVRESEFKVNDKGYVQLPEALDKAIEFDGAKYKMGIGGLHSQEKKQAIVAGPQERLGELDVASMYPSIILGQNLYPEHLGEGFCEVYREIFDQRIEAKTKGDKIVSDSLKLVLNSSYGKFGNRYSYLYSPELLIQTTITGQLALLMLIERLTEVGRVVSANTDGVVVLYPGRYQNVLDDIAQQWTAETSYVLEWTPYSSLYSESVNSYIAVKPDGGSKRKGLYAGGSIGKGYANQVSINAAAAYLERGTPIAETIFGCDDIRDFLIMRGVKGGAQWRGQELGKVVRWYQSTNGEPIQYRSNGNKVAGSDGAAPMMDLIKGIPEDLDYDWYCAKAIKMLGNLGVGSAEESVAKNALRPHPLEGGNATVICNGKQHVVSESDIHKKNVEREKIEEINDPWA